ncbi:MAG: hypothetical protein O3A21_06730, partial [Proteobacteria bacterium]|nr:hypothetical protein [Pseudomonadota bacterium]
NEVRVDIYAGLLDLADAASAAADHIRVRSLMLFGANDGSVTLTAVCDALARLRSPSTAIYYLNAPHLILQMSDNLRAFADIRAWIGGLSPPSRSDAKAAVDLARLCRARLTAG